MSLKYVKNYSEEVTEQDSDALQHKQLYEVHHLLYSTLQ